MLNFNANIQQHQTYKPVLNSPTRPSESKKKPNNDKTLVLAGVCLASVFVASAYLLNKKTHIKNLAGEIKDLNKPRVDVREKIIPEELAVSADKITEQDIIKAAEDYLNGLFTPINPFVSEIKVGNKKVPIFDSQFRLFKEINDSGNAHIINEIPEEFVKDIQISQKEFVERLDSIAQFLRILNNSGMRYYKNVGKSFNIEIGKKQFKLIPVKGGELGIVYKLETNNGKKFAFKVFNNPESNRIVVGGGVAGHGSYAETVLGKEFYKEKVNNSALMYCANPTPEGGWILSDFVDESYSVRKEGISWQDFAQKYYLEGETSNKGNFINGILVDLGGFLPTNRLDDVQLIKSIEDELVQKMQAFFSEQNVNKRLGYQSNDLDYLENYPACRLNVIHRIFNYLNLFDTIPENEASEIVKKLSVYPETKYITRLFWEDIAESPKGIFKNFIEGINFENAREKIQEAYKGMGIEVLTY